MDFSKLSRNQQIALGGGVLAIISLFVPWYGVWAYYNNVVSEWLQVPMLFLGQWRLPVLLKTCK